MAGHSKFANIKHRKGAQDAKRAKIFTRLIRELIVAAKGGEDVNGNPRLRSAIIAAKAANMPKDKIENAIKKGSNSGEGDNYENFKYEAYGPGGSAFIVEVLTDNKNRTASSVRAAFSKYGGSLAESGSVSFMFDHFGIIRYLKGGISEDEMFEVAVDAGSEGVDTEEGHYVISTDVVNFAKVRDVLIEKYGDPESLGLEWIAKDVIDVAEDKKEVLLKMIDVLEEDDDVQNIYTNAGIGEVES